MKSYHKFLDHTADALFMAEADTLSELFEQCALAVQEVMINPLKVQAQQKVEITGENKNIENLLFDFLDDLIYHKDAEQLVFSHFEVKIEEKEGEVFQLKCIAFGEKINPEKHEPKVDIKAITMHMFEVKRTETGTWQAQVLVDV